MSVGRLRPEGGRELYLQSRSGTQLLEISKRSWVNDILQQPIFIIAISREPREDRACDC